MRSFHTQVDVRSHGCTVPAGQLLRILPYQQRRLSEPAPTTPVPVMRSTGYSGCSFALAFTNTTLASQPGSPISPTTFLRQLSAVAIGMAEL